MMSQQVLADKQKLAEILKSLIPYGYKCYTTKIGAWGYIITPNDNVLYIQSDYLGRWNLLLQYQRTSENGEWCNCLNAPVSTINLDIVQQAEQEGLSLAKRLKAPLYSSSSEWRKHCWEAASLEEVKLENTKSVWPQQF